MIFFKAWLSNEQTFPGCLQMYPAGEEEVAPGTSWWDPGSTQLCLPAEGPLSSPGLETKSPRARPSQPSGSLPAWPPTCHTAQCEATLPQPQGRSKEPKTNLFGITAFALTNVGNVFIDIVTTPSGQQHF